ncbi:MAG TPA: Gfo/Idh/MocA family oxidoreductase [Acidimicrobiia bacterium]|nr:Gfo/Idh/MocA family oxidoreductase [Acidimicrobiia bacterium]
MDRVRIGIVGTGNIAQLNVRGYLQHPKCDVVAVCDPRLPVAEAAARAWNVPKVYEHLDDLLADDEVDAVEILTPTYLHKEHTLAAVRAGKHVSCQKPIANSVADGREMVAAASDAGVVFRVSECCFHYPPLVKAKALVASGAIGAPTMIRIKTLVGETDSEFQRNIQPEGYTWRFNDQSPGGHLFDDMVHKYGLALWVTDESIRSVQAVVRMGPLFFEAPMAAIFEYERDDLVGTMEVAYAPHMYIRSAYYGADEVVEIQGTEGLVWVTRCIGELHDLPPLLLYRADGTREAYSQIEADWGEGFVQSSRHFVDALLEGRTDPEMSGDLAIRTLQLCFAVYEASNTRAPVEPASIATSVSPPWWPKTPEQLMKDVESLGLI